MNKLFLAIISLISMSAAAQPDSNNYAKVKTTYGTLEGSYNSGIYKFLGVPFAAPPIKDLRWKEPQPPASWTGIRKATSFGPRPMQLPLFSDMMFRSPGMSEDCLYLNVWTPTIKTSDKLPVLVYFYGGGLVGGDASEYRYDGESMSRRGIVAVTVNYRLGVFGFLAHPELTKESPNHASGNYGLLDQYAALKWVQENIAAFGGDPKKVTIAGESAGSFSVSAQMASPLSKNLIAGAIGESGSILGRRRTASLQEAEQTGVKFAASVGASSLKELRATTAGNLLQATGKPGVSFPITIDGYFFPKNPAEIFEAGEQAQVPLLAGWNTQEGSYESIFGKDAITKENYAKAIGKLYPEHAADIVNLYAGTSKEDLKQAATDLASDRFIGFSTWKWIDLHANSTSKPIYRYWYAKPRPKERKDTTAAAATGAVHSGEIEYALGNLPTNRVFDWQADDYLVSTIMQAYFENFIKTGNPNGMGVPEWPTLKKGEPAELMYINVDTHPITEVHRDRYLFLDKISSK